MSRDKGIVSVRSSGERDIGRSASLKVLLVAEESAGIHALRALARTRHQIVAVLTTPPGGPSATRATVSATAQQLGYPTWPAHLVREPGLAGRVRAEGVDIMLNVHSLYVVHPEVLGAPRIAAFNMHPGPLPRYAGLNTISWAISRGETTYGVTIHEMVETVDAGRIAYEAAFPIEGTDTPLILMSKCVKIGVPLLMELLETASRVPRGIPLREQDLSRREYFGREIPDGGRLRWAQPAQKVVNFVRACEYSPLPSPWGHPRARLGERDIAIVKASRTGEPTTEAPGTVGRGQGSGVRVACRDEWIFVHRVMIDGEHVNPPRLFEPGCRLGDGR